MSWRFFAISPGARGPADLRPWIPVLASRVTDLVLREPTRTRAELEPLARLALDAGLAVWVHVKCPGAAGLAADLRCGLHLPAHAAAPHDRPFGQSCHDRASLDAAFDRGAAYAFLSPVFPPTSKPDDVRPTLGEARLHALAAGRPVIALGGIDPDRAHALRSAGAAGIAVLGGIFGAPLDTLPALLERYPGSEVSGPSTMNSSGS
ncbi:MAG: thiamine phosphate synthase [Myxococcota bacterium]